MTKLYFVRHGKTEWNLEGRYQGSKGDSPLLPESYEEIKELAAYLKKIKFAKIYCSPLKRTMTTAREIKKYLNQPGIQIEADQAFMEFNLGKMEKMKFTDAEAKYPKEVNNFRHHPDKYDPTAIHGESYVDLFNRMTPKIKEICQRYPDENILIVSHGAALGAEIRHLMGVDLAHLRDKGGLANTSTTILQTNDGKQFKCLAWNKTDYLKRKLDATDVI